MIKNYFLLFLFGFSAVTAIPSLNASKVKVAVGATVLGTLMYPIAHSADASVQTQLIGYNFGLGVLKQLLVKGKFIQDKHVSWKEYLCSAAVLAANVDALVRYGGYKNKWDYLRAPLVHGVSYVLGSLVCDYVWPKDSSKNDSNSLISRSNGKNVINNIINN